MAVRTDITVDYKVSPRIITIAVPSTSITIEDLYDTLRTIEDDVDNLDDAFLISAGGREQLGGGIRVGVTATLNNARLAFQARRIPLSTGTVTSAGSPEIGSPTSFGSPPKTGRVLNDSIATFQADGVSAGDIVFNCTDQSVGEVSAANSETEVVLGGTSCAPGAPEGGLGGGSDNTFETGDVYAIYDIVQCQITEGNLVATGPAGAGSPDTATTLDPVFPTFGTQVVRSSTTAGVQIETGISGLTGAEVALLTLASTSAADTWDELRAAHGISGSFGEAITLILNSIGSPIGGSPTGGQLTVANIVAGVWSELVLGSPLPFPIGAAGNVLALISETAGLTQAQVSTAVWSARSDEFSGSPIIGSPTTMGAQLNLVTAKSCDILTFTETLLKFQANRTVLDKIAFTLTIYDNDRVTPIRVFDLRELGVGPSITEITERLPASGSPLTP